MVQVWKDETGFWWADGKRLPWPVVPANTPEALAIARACSETKARGKLLAAGRQSAIEKRRALTSHNQK